MVTKLAKADLQYFVFTFIKHLFKRRDVLHIKFLVEKVINYIVLMGTIRYNVKQVKQKPLKVCITCEKILKMGG